jgi:hypothetical protein
MLDLRRRREFQGKHLRGTAIDLPKSADLPAAAHLEITYLSTDVLTAIEAIGPAQERPVVLIGDRGYGKSHLMAWLHHALHEPAAARAWLCEWAAALDRPASVCFPSATSRLSSLLCPFPSVTVPLSSQVDPLPQSVASRLAGEAPEPLPTGRTTANQRGRAPTCSRPKSLADGSFAPAATVLRQETSNAGRALSTQTLPAPCYSIHAGPRPVAGIAERSAAVRLGQIDHRPSRRPGSARCEASRGARLAGGGPCAAGVAACTVEAVLGSACATACSTARALLVPASWGNRSSGLVSPVPDVDSG